MVFDKYSKQAPSKPAVGSEPQKPAAGAPPSTFLSRLAGQAASPTQSSGYGGGSRITWGSKDPGSSTRASIEKRLHWVETAFKKGEERQLGGGTGDPKMVVSSVRNRINALLTYDLPPKVRSELELIDKELNKLL